MSSDNSQLSTLYSGVSLQIDSKRDDLEEVVISLPITSVIKDERPFTDPKEIFESSLTKSGGIIPFGDVIDQVSYRLLNNSKTIVLTPLVLNNSLDIKFRKVQLRLPDLVLKDCLSAHKITKDSFIIDILTQEGLFITLSFETKDFISGQSHITANNFSHWGKFDMPYSIEYRKPHSIQTLSEQLTIVPFKDGGLLQLKRKSKFEQVETVTFTDSSYFDSLTKFFKKNPDNEFIENKLSVRTVISSALLNDKYLITLSINKKLKVWSLETHSIILEQEVASSGTYLDTSPSKLIRLIDSPSANEFRLSTLIPLKEKKIIIWSLAIANDKCLLQEDFKIVAPKIDETNWIVQSYQLHKNQDEKAKLFLLLRSNILEKLLICDVDLRTNEYFWFNSKDKVITDQLEYIDSLHFAESINEYYLTKLASDYNSIILDAVLNIFEIHYQHRVAANNLKDKVLQIVQYNLDPEDMNYLRDLKNQWSKFDGSCKELLKQCVEPIDLTYDGKSAMIYVLKSFGLSIFKEASFIELLSLNPHEPLSDVFLNIAHTAVNSTNLTQLVTLARDFQSVFNDDTLEELKYSISQFKKGKQKTEETMASIFDELLSPCLTEDLISQLLTRLGSISSVVEVLEVLSSNTTEIERFISSKLSTLGESLLTESFKAVLKVYESLTLGLILIILVIDNNDQVLTFFEKFTAKYQSYRLANLALSISEGELFTTVVYKNFQVEGFELRDSATLNSILSSMLAYITSSDSFLISSIVQLVHDDDAKKVAKSGLLEFLGTESPVHQFLKAVVYAKLSQDDKSFKIINANAEKIVRYVLSPQEVSDFDGVSSLSAVFGSSLLKYYVVFTNFFMENNFTKNAYSLAKLAIKNYDADRDVDSTDKDIIHWNLFQLSLKLADYDKSFLTINNLSPQLKFKSIKIFVLHLLDTKSISTLLKYNFKENISLVDSIILDLAQQQDFLINSLNYFKILYSWRLKSNDKRGAAEALYQFVDKYERSGHQIKSIQIRPLYVVILNVVKTISDADDQWIIKKVDDGDDLVVTYSDLEEELNKKF